MVQFEYVITDEIGIHARPAGMLAKEAKKFQSIITIEKNGKIAIATKLMAIMGLSVRCHDKVTVTADGTDEEEAAAAIKKFFEENL